MKKVDIVYPGSLSSAIGPSQIIKRLKDSENIFIENNIELNVFDRKIKSFKGKKYLKTNIKNEIFGSKILYSYLYILRIEFNRFKFIRDYCNKNREVDVVVFDHVTAFIFFTMMNKNKNVKIVLFQHNSGDISEMGKKRFPSMKNSAHIKIIENIFFNRVDSLDRIVFISKFAKNIFDIANPKLKYKTETIINGIPDIDYHIDDNKNSDGILKLISVGTVSNRKGQDIILKALSNLDKKLLSNFRLIIVGVGPEYNEFKQLATELNIEDNVQFVGEKEQNEVFKLLNKSSVFILMSHSEGLPLSILEALRVGLPIITSNAGGCPETVSNKNGFVIKPDALELTHILKKLNIVELNIMSKKSRELFEKDYKFESFLNQYIKLMKDV